MAKRIKLFIVFILCCSLTGIIGATFWFWITPVGVTNYVNKITFQMALESPETLTYLGMIDNTILDFHSDELDDYTKEKEETTLRLLVKARSGLNEYGPEELSGQELLTWEITAWFLDNQIDQLKFSHDKYRINQISGVTVDLPQFLTDTHAVLDKRSAERYLLRLKEFARVLGEVRIRVIDDAAHGVIPPDFIVEKTLSGLHAFISDGAQMNPLVTTFKKRLSGLNSVTEDERNKFSDSALDIVEKKILPEYKSIIDIFKDFAGNTNQHAGIWRIPNGEAIYKLKLQSSTTTDINAENIHELGLTEVRRINIEMEQLLIKLGYTGGTVAERVKKLMEAPDQLFSNTDQGRREMINYLESLDEVLMAQAPEFFSTIPPQPLEIIRVPVYAQNSSPGGYYQSPALDGSRPGRFYINQKDTADNPRWTLPTFMYHEAAPGHHFQLSASQLIEGVPLLRKLSPFGAYTEGWALYAERIAKTDMGMYENYPLGDLGRLQSEMFRAVRLVVDSGMHAKRWSRERAITYMIENTGMTEAEVTREIERYVVWPGQATSYKTGQLRILELRGIAERRLRDNFDLKHFHDFVLMNGGMPLDILSKQFDRWIESISMK